MALPGDTLRTYARVVHPDNSPNTGLTMIPDVLVGPSGELGLERFSFAETGDGFYEIYVQTYPDDPYGEYELHFHANNFVDGEPENSAFTEDWTLFQQTPTAPGLDSNMGVPRLEVRQMAAGMLNDYWTGTAATGGEFGAITDPIQFARESSYFNGMQIHFTNPESPNYGRIATVTRSDGPTRTIYFEPPLPHPVVTGDTVDLYNFRSRGTTIDRYNAGINDAIRMARQQHALVPISYTFDTMFARHIPYLMVPRDFVSFYGLETATPDGYFYQVRPRDIRVDRMSRRIEITSRSAAERLHGRYLTVRGYAMPSLLMTDEERTSIDLEWLLNEVKAQVLERLILGGAPVGSQDRLFLQERTEANGKRAVIIAQALPNTVRFM
jgi:hypothetical protein